MIMLQDDFASKIKIHAFIISWHGMHEKAARIAESIFHLVDELTVIYSNNSGTIESGAGNWVSVPDDWFYGKKFAECLRIYKSGIMLQIQADAISDAWPKVIDRCKNNYLAYKDLGVWAPNIDGTPHFFDQVFIGYMKDTSLAIVTQTDGVVWALAPQVLLRLGQLNYDVNNLGHGIDWFAICYANAHNLLVVRDMSLVVSHPTTRGYDSKNAQIQMRDFFKQMTFQEEAQYYLLDDYMKSRTV